MSRPLDGVEAGKVLDEQLREPEHLAPSAPPAAPYAPPDRRPVQPSGSGLEALSGIRAERERAHAGHLAQVAAQAATQAGQAAQVAAQAAQVAQAAAQTAALRVAGAAGTATRHTVAGAKRAASSVGRFFIGFGFFWRGLAFFLRNPRLWLWALLPVALTALCLLGVEKVVAMAIKVAVDWLLGFVASWPSAVRWALGWVMRWAAETAFHLLITALTVPVTMFFGAFFLPFMTRSVVRLTGGGHIPPPSWWRASGVCLRQTVVVTLVLHVGWLICLPLLLLPGFNLAVAFGVGLFFNGFLVGVLVLAVSLHHHGVHGAKQHLKFAWQHRAYVTGFGMMSVIALILPVLSLRFLVAVPIPEVFAAPGAVLYLITSPAVLVGAILLHRRILGVLPPAPVPPPWPDPRLRYGQPHVGSGHLQLPQGDIRR
ncbi:EI24 domain-containing protein [Dactylosporangium sp. NPDC005555]|uniref:EI24 domain-containing protein n=1 Tax=Dactylosporangium sp. NPDC005555 TaxID=3154889 RepID=UPI0033AB3DA9